MKTHSSSKVALVTGAGKRLGRHIAIALSKNGYDVIVHYNTSREGALQTVKAIQKNSQRAIALKADVTKKSSVQQLVKKAVAHFGRIDLLVNNAGVFVESDFNKISESMWDKTLDINLKGPFLFAQTVEPYMTKQGSGKIINIASLGGIQAWGKRHLPYSVSKAGVIMLTRSLAKSLAPAIHVNAIAPGYIEMDEAASTTTRIPVESIPLKRYGTSSDITDMIIFLATTATYITGQVFAIDGGRSV